MIVIVGSWIKFLNEELSTLYVYQITYIRFEILSVARMKMAVVWVVPCRLLDVYRRPRSVCCRHYQSEHPGGKKLL